MEPMIKQKRLPILVFHKLRQNDRILFHKILLLKQYSSQRPAPKVFINQTGH